jgi:dienelactone hydrolase
VRGSWGLGAAVLVVVAVLPAATAAATDGRPEAQAAVVKIVITPSVALVDQPVDVRLTGLQPGRKVTLQATTRGALGRAWRSRLFFESSRGGIVDTHSNMKLFWSMRPVKNPRAPANFKPPLGDTPVRLRVFVAGRAVGSATLLRRVSAPNVIRKETTLAAEGFVGEYFTPAPGSPAPAVLRIGGAAGGHNPIPAALLASHGYPTLALGYFREPGLPQTPKNIPFEYFAKALRWLAEQPGVDPEHITVLGVSLGGEAALLLGASFPNLVHGVIACAPSSQVSGVWTIGGQQIPYGPIPVERIAGPALVTGGGKDAVWPSASFVRLIVERAREHGRRDIVGHIYPRAGHIGCEIPNLPVAQILVSKDPAGRTAYVPIGGTRLANSQASAAFWPLVLRFLRTLS